SLINIVKFLQRCAMITANKNDLHLHKNAAPQHRRKMRSPLSPSSSERLPPCQLLLKPERVAGWLAQLARSCQKNKCTVCSASVNVMANSVFLVSVWTFMTFVTWSCSGSQLPEGEIWAVLVAGSNGYGNYRHQADVCHAYHVLREHGVPADHIITMMYDDIAYSPENPYPGTIINAVNGSNVYEGVFRDYIGKDVNSTNFLKVITGDAEGLQGVGSGRVLKSGPNDHVFINFVDHGADYLICFPNDTDELYAPDLLKAFMEMSEKEMYAKMVVYIEACESGSLFDNFLSNKLNITAAKRDQDSYACCWDAKVEAYLGDVFSVNWMEDSDSENLEEETLSEQYSVVVKETNTSNPQEFGTLSIGRLPVGQFMGTKQFPKPSKSTIRCGDEVGSPNVPIAVLQRKLEKKIADKSTAEITHLESQIRTLFKNRRSVDHVMEHLLSIAYGSDKEFITQSPYGLQKLHIFANICMEDTESAEKMINAMNAICPLIKVKNGWHACFIIMETDDVVSRESVMTLIHEKDKIEDEIKQMKTILENNNIGMNEPLVDDNGFPRSDIDVYQVRHARHRIICLQNDHKKLMKEIENALHALHAQEQHVNGSSSSGVSTSFEHTEPIGRINFVSPNSPAADAGVLEGDIVVEFGSVNASNFKSLQDIGNIVQHSVGRSIAVRVKREEKFIRLSLTPCQWSGRGLLGCNILPWESVER
ncbi:26S proteasome non-ATPase regulatory subunit 9, partial [Gryllus bimaculatus]